MRGLGQVCLALAITASSVCIVDNAMARSRSNLPPPEEYFVSPPERVQHRFASERTVAVKEVLEKCPVATEPDINEECWSILDEFFLSTPIWDYYRIYYYRDFGLDRLPNVAERTLEFGYEDYVSMESVPLHRDIFDGRYEQRKKEAYGVIESERECFELGSSREVNSGIDEQLFDQCKARELYKLGAYESLCNSAVTRDELLHKGEKPAAEVSAYYINQKFQETGEVQEILDRVREDYLNVLWVKRKCGSQYEGPGAGDLWNRIAAQAGDEWARREINLQSTGKEFIEAIREKEPILYYRTLSAYGPGINRDMNRAKAYLLLESKLGTVEADHMRDEWFRRDSELGSDSSKEQLAVAIEELRNGAKMPIFNSLPMSKQLDVVRDGSHIPDIYIPIGSDTQ